MRTLLVLLALALVLPTVCAFHEACPATPADLTVRALDTGVYVFDARVYQETNGHSGLQTGTLPPGCVADTQLA